VSDVVITNALVEALIAQDDNRPRTQQKELGPSSLGFCRAKSVFQLLDYPETNPTLRLPAIMGTAIHASVEEAMHTRFGDEYMLEIEVPGIPGFIAPGHIDCYHPASKHIYDWKTSSKRNLRYFPKQSQRWQVQTYGYLARKAGYEVDWLTLVAIPRDGNETEIKIHTEAYDERIVEEAFAWQQSVIDYVNNGEIPAPEAHPNVCRGYCPFYGELCQGKP
jgi:hypothetical protein